MQENLLQLSGTTLSFQQSLPKHQYLLVSGGRPPETSWLRSMARPRKLWCIDHGIDCCYAAGLLPDHLFGDGDSASKEAWHWAKAHNVPIEKYQTKKDFTDTQLALDYVSHDADAFIVLTGCFGNRFDHLYSIIFSCAHASRPICLADEQEIIFPLKAGNKLEITFSNHPLALSLLPLTDICTGVSINNVHWPLQNAILRQSVPNAISNVPEGQPITVSLSDGILGIYLCFDTSAQIR